MAGFKKTIQDYGPAGFFTFDGDAFDANTRLITHVPLTVLDESGNANDGLMMVGSQEPTKAYRAGMPSLVSIEPSNQYSMGFGTYGRVNGVWPKAFVQVPHHTAYDNATNFGSFTVALLFNKPADETYLRNTEYPALAFSNFVKTLMWKPGMIRIQIHDPYSTADFMRFVFPNGNIDVPAANVVDFYNSNHLVIARWEVRPVSGGTGYVGVATAIIDGVIVGTLSTSYTDVPPVTAVNQPMEIGGTSTSSSVYDDRATTAIYIDQVAVWNRALKNVEMWRLFKKVWEYQEMVMKKGPTIYLPLQDDEAINDTNLFKRGYGSISSAIALTTGPTIRVRAGPPNIPAARGILFNKAMLQIRGTYVSNPGSWLSWNADNYAIEFWIKTGGSERAVIFSAQGADKPYSGPLVELNVGPTGGFLNGALAFTESEGNLVSTPTGGFINNGSWHHVIVQRRAGLYLEIIVDGQLMASKQVPKAAGLNAWANVIYMMGSAPGKLYCDGELSHLAIYNGKTFDEFEASSRYQYAVIYRVRGNTTLRGVPYRARVRLYNYRTGELVDQGDSAASDGSFTFYLKDNALLCSQILSMADTNVRVRGFGPISPAEIPDSPITL